MTIRAVMFDFSGTLFRLEEDDSWFAELQVDEREVDGHVQAELMRRLTAPTGRSVEMDEQTHQAWVNRDLAVRSADRSSDERVKRKQRMKALTHLSVPPQ